MSDDPAALRRALERLDRAELRLLCQDLEVTPEDLPAATRDDLARELLIYVQRRDQTPRLVAALARYGLVLAPLRLPDDVPAVAPLPRGSHVPVPHNPCAIGRDAVLREVARRILDRDVALTGLGGLGKTQVAAEFAHRYGPRFAGGVFWIDADDPLKIAAQVERCGVTLGIAGFAEHDFEERVTLVRDAWSRATPRLLIFDDCWDERVLADWRPTSGGCRVLITSRRDSWDEAIVAAVPLPPLARPDSIALLRGFRPDLPPDDPDLDAIAAELGDLPLALHLAGSYLKRYRMHVRPADYLGQIRAPDLLRHRSLTGGAHTHPSPTGHEQHVERTFLVSYERLDRAVPTDALALRLLACAARFVAGLALPSRLLLAGDRRADPLDQVDALGRLHDLGLLERLSEDAVRLHRLLARFTDDQTPAEAAAAGRLAAEDSVIRLLDGELDLDGWDDQATLDAHIAAVVAEAFDRYIQAGDGDSAAAVQLTADAHMAARGGHALALERHAALLGRTRSPRLTMQSLSRLAMLKAQQGDRRAAVGHLTEALEIADELEDPRFRSALLGDLSTVYELLGMLDEAVRSLESALALARAAKSRSLEAKWLLNLGGCAVSAGEIGRARELFLLARDAAPPESATVDLCESRLAFCAFACGRLLEAREGYARVLAAARARRDLAREAVALGNLANCAAHAGDLATAERDLREAIDRCRATGQLRAEGHLLHTLAEVLADQARFAEAIGCAREGQRIAARLGNPQLAAEHAAAIARAALLGGDPPAALDAARQAARAGDRLSAPVAMTLAGAASLALGDRGGAAGWFRDAAAHAEALLAHTPELYTTRDTLGLALAGLALAGDRAHAPPAADAFAAAGAVGPAPGAARRALALLDAMAGHEAGAADGGARAILAARAREGA